MMIVSVLTVLIGASSAAAQTPPATRPPATQTPPRPAPQAPAPAPTAPTTRTPATTTPTPPAAPVPFPADAKIGFVNMQLIVAQSQLGKSGQDRMKELNDKKSTELTGLNKQIQTLQQEVQTGANVLSAAVLGQKNTELDKLTREVQFRQEQAQVDIQNLNDQLLDEFSQKVLPIVEQIRAEKNLWVVFALGDGTGVAAVHAGLDLSSEVVKRLDATK
ncbi:MAG: OmpH family outer membrane protein [Vicinamibacterales bacterium]